jgi:hypothetical protein
MLIRASGLGVTSENASHDDDRRQYRYMVDEPNALDYCNISSEATDST